MSKQSKAQRLAEMIERYSAGVHSQAIVEDYASAAAELRRLDALVDELVEAVEAALSDDQPYIEKCRAALAKAKEQT